MKEEFLLITGADGHYWYPILQEALAQFGTLHIGSLDAPGAGSRDGRYSLIIVDASASDDLAHAVARLRTEQPSARTVVVTISPTWRRAREAFQAGAVEYIRKSISLRELRTTFERILTTPAGPTLSKHKDYGGSMARATILFADNDQDFLRTRKEFLEQDGYQVFTAANPVEARNVLESGQVDVAVIDIRLRDDHDERDQSGLYLAKEVAPSIPKIILTNHPSWTYAREMLIPDEQGWRAAVDFIAKEEGPDALLHAIRKAIATHKVFIVHGHDEAAKMTVARFVERLGLRPVILQEESSAGRTIIEKFEDSSNVNFAIVLLTPDDLGATRAMASANLQSRARQNVIFELGYFIGKLGRNRVCALFKEGVELPSDYQGVVYLEMDQSGGWKVALAREMKAAGLYLDLNKAL